MDSSNNKSDTYNQLEDPKRSQSYANTDSPPPSTDGAGIITALPLFPELTERQFQARKIRVKKVKPAKVDKQRLWEDGNRLASETEKKIQRGIDKYYHDVKDCRKKYNDKFILKKRRNELQAPIQFDFDLLHDHIDRLPEHEQKERREIVNRAERRQVYQKVKRATKHQLRRKIRNKVISQEIIMNLMLCNPNSKLFQSYMNSLNYCQYEYVQDGLKITSKYCNCRHCYSCNRIRSGKLINSYMPFIEWMKNDMHFVTLTIKNIDADLLPGSINKMKKDFGLIKDVMRKRGMNLVGLRKMECTFSRAKGFHPHFHLLIQNKAHADLVKDLWLQYNPTSDIKGQDVKPADMSSVHELFKYFTKFWSKKKNGNEMLIDYKAQDAIYNAISGHRIFQPFGMKKFKDEMKQDIDENEDIEPLQSIHYNIEPRQAVFSYSERNFVDVETGEVLIHFQLNKRDLKLIEDLDKSVFETDEKRKRPPRNVFKPPAFDKPVFMERYQFKTDQQYQEYLTKYEGYLNNRDSGYDGVLQDDSFTFDELNKILKNKI